MIAFDLLATYRAAPLHSPEWMEAVRAIGRASKKPAKPPLPVRKTYWQTIWLITKSHHFTEGERIEYRRRAELEHGSEALYKTVTGLVATRAKAERQQLKAAKALVA